MNITVQPKPKVDHTRPFHETVVETINQASSSDMDCLAPLIKATTIPKGHDEIIVAWNKRRKEMGWGSEDLGVPANLLEQKQTSIKKANDDKKGISFHLVSQALCKQ
ncbi:MAG: hypothetical protein Q7R72_00725 [bacterium]|nr:hypothetical protein [bacterium]